MTSKKLTGVIALLIIIFFNTFSLNAQNISYFEAPKKKNYTSIYGSVTANKIWNGLSKYNNRFLIGYQFGVAKNYTINNNWQLTGQLGISQVGLKYTLAGYVGTLDTTNIPKSVYLTLGESRMNYLFPKIGIKHTLRFSSAIDIQFGLNIFGGVLLNSYEHGKDLFSSQKYYTKTTEVYKKINWGVEPEIGLKISLANNYFFVSSLTYEAGFENIYHNRRIAPGSGPLTGMTRAFCLKLSFPVF